MKPLSDNDNDDDEDPGTSSQRSRALGKDTRRSKNIRRARQESSSEEEVNARSDIPVEETLITGNVQNNQHTSSTAAGKVATKHDSSSESDIDKIEEATQRDLEERDQLSKRIREREKKDTRHVVSKSQSKAAEEASKRLAL